MAGLGSLPSLGSLGGSRTSRRRKEETPGLQPGQQQPRQPAAQPQQTFAQLQSQGIARPAPPPAPVAPATQQYGGSQQAQQARGGLETAVNQALQNPSRYDNAAFTQIRDSAQADLKNQFGKERQSLEEDLARRGLSASTIGTNDLYSLKGSQDRSLANLDAQLLQQAANTQSTDRAAAYGMGSDFASLAGSQDLAQFGANANAGQQGFSNQLASAQFGQGQYDNAANLALSAANSAGNLGLSQQQLAQQGSQFGQDLSQRQLENTQQYGLQQQGQNEQSRQFNLSQALQEALGMGGLANQGRAQNLAELENSQQYGLAQQGQNEQSRQFNLQQQLAQALGMGNLDVSRQQANTAAQGQANNYNLGVRGQDLQQGQFNSDLYQRQKEQVDQTALANRGYNLQESGMRQDDAQFYQSLYDQQAARRDAGDLSRQGMADENARFYSGQNFQGSQADKDRQIQNRGLALNELTAGWDEGFRQKELAQQGQLGNRGLDIQGQSAAAQDRLANNNLMYAVIQAMGGLSAEDMEKFKQQFFGAAGGGGKSRGDPNMTPTVGTQITNPAPPLPPTNNNPPEIPIGTGTRKPNPINPNRIEYASDGPFDFQNAQRDANGQLTNPYGEANFGDDDWTDADAWTQAQQFYNATEDMRNGGLSQQNYNGFAYGQNWGDILGVGPTNPNIGASLNGNNELTGGGTISPQQQAYFARIRELLGPYLQQQLAQGF